MYLTGAATSEATTRVSRGPLPSGHAGTRVTLELMRELARRGSTDPEVRELALAIVARVPAHQPAAELDALFRYVRDRIRFTNDPVGVELLQDPRTTLRLGAGDCDDRAVLLAALMLSIGICADLRFRVIGVDPLRPREFSHVYLVARVGGTDVPLDPTFGSTPAGWEHPRPTLTGDFPLCT